MSRVSSPAAAVRGRGRSARFGAAFGLALLAAGGVTAQPEVAPPPRPSLNEVVREYRRLGLPLPPPDAPLVRVGRWERNFDEPGRPRLSAALAFRLPPPWPKADARYWLGRPTQTAREQAAQWHNPRHVEPVEPTVPITLAAGNSPDECIGLAVACRLRGWNDLADQLYALARETSDEFGFDSGVVDQVRQWAFDRWSARLDQPGTDRAEVLRHLQLLLAGGGGRFDGEVRTLLDGLKATVNHPKSRPNSIEALIDGLTEYHFGPGGDAAFMALAERGFEAVPAMIDHLQDKRPSRAHRFGFLATPTDWVTVGHLCGHLLWELSCGAIDGEDWMGPVGRRGPAPAREWFRAAERVGEERWLLDCRRPASMCDGRVPARALAVKYPHHLPTLYRAALRERPNEGAAVLAEAVAASRLPHERKVAVLEEGAAGDDPRQVSVALRALQQVDAKRVRRHLPVAFALVRKALAAGREDALAIDMLVELVLQSGDPAAWEQLTALTPTLPPNLRMQVIRAIDAPVAPDWPDPDRRHKLKFLSRFLDDRAVGKVDDAVDGDWAEVRDRTAGQLATWFRWDIATRPDPAPMPDPDAGPLSRLVLREAVRAAVGRELAGTTR